MRMRIIAGSILTTAQIHHRVVDFLDFIPVKISVTLLRYHSIYHTLLTLVVICQSVSVILRITLFENRASLILPGAVDNSTRVKLLLVKIQLNSIGFQIHILEFYFAVAVQKSFFVIQIYRHRICRLICDNLFHRIFRDWNQAIYLIHTIRNNSNRISYIRFEISSILCI